MWSKWDLGSCNTDQESSLGFASPVPTSGLCPLCFSNLVQSPWLPFYLPDSAKVLLVSSDLLSLVLGTLGQTTRLSRPPFFFVMRKESSMLRSISFGHMTRQQCSRITGGWGSRHLAVYTYMGLFRVSKQEHFIKHIKHLSNKSTRKKQSSSTSLVGQVNGRKLYHAQTYQFVDLTCQVTGLCMCKPRVMHCLHALEMRPQKLAEKCDTYMPLLQPRSENEAACNGNLYENKMELSAQMELCSIMTTKHEMYWNVLVHGHFSGAETANWLLWLSNPLPR